MAFGKSKITKATTRTKGSGNKPFSDVLMIAHDSVTLMPLVMFKSDFLAGGWGTAGRERGKFYDLGNGTRESETF